MKKLMRYGVCLAVILTLMAVPAFAGDRQHFVIDEFEISAYIPIDMYVLTKDFDAQDPILAELGFDAQWLAEYYESNHVYLNAVERDYAYEIEFMIIPQDAAEPAANFSLYSDAELLEAGDEFAATYLQAGIPDASFELYHHRQTPFLKFSFEVPNEADSIYIENYYTIYDGNEISVMLYSYSGEVTHDMEARLLSIVESAEFPGASAAVIAEHLEPDVSGQDGSPSAIVLTIFYIICICTAPILIYRYAIKKAPLPTHQDTRAPGKLGFDFIEVRRCSACGTRLMEGSNTCEKCGAHSKKRLW